MRTLVELVNDADPGWPLVLEAVHGAENHTRVLPTTRTRGEAALLALQVTSRSPMGAIALESGGIAVDHGWVRILGAGGPEMDGDIARWNALGPAAPLAPPLEHALRVAFDAVGGTFAINGGGLGPDLGKAYYFAPDSLEWEPLDRGYSDLLQLFFRGDLAKFYEGARWAGWEQEIAVATLDHGIHLWPPLCSKEGEDPSKVSRKAVPLAELVPFHEDMRRQLT